MNKSVSIQEISSLMKEKLSSGGDVYLTVVGGSMYPFFLDGKTEVQISPLSGPIKRNQVLFYEVKGQYILHRVLKVKENLVITRGDALYQKEYIDISNVLGIVKSHQTKSKTISYEKKGYLFLVSCWQVFSLMKRLNLFFLRRVIHYGQ